MKDEAEHQGDGVAVGLDARRCRDAEGVKAESCWRCGAVMEWRHGTWQCGRCRFKLGCCEGEPQSSCEPPQAPRR